MITFLGPLKWLRENPKGQIPSIRLVGMAKDNLGRIPQAAAEPELHPWYDGTNTVFAAPNPKMNRTQKSKQQLLRFEQSPPSTLTSLRLRTRLCEFKHGFRVAWAL